MAQLQVSLSTIPSLQSKLPLIRTQKAREQGLFWGTIGYIPTSPIQVTSKGQCQLVDSGHAHGAIPYYKMMDDEGGLKENNTKNGKAPVHSAPDLHAMLDVTLASLVKLFKTGLKWNVVYKDGVHKDIELVFFVPFIRCDTDEADKLCGSYTSRGKNASEKPINPKLPHRGHLALCI